MAIYREPARSCSPTAERTDSWLHAGLQALNTDTGPLQNAGFAEPKPHAQPEASQQRPPPLSARPEPRRASTSSDGSGRFFQSILGD